MMKNTTDTDTATGTQLPFSLLETLAALYDAQQRGLDVTIPENIRDFNDMIHRAEMRQIREAK